MYELGNPEWDILSDLSSGEIAHAFKLEAGFGDITGPFLDLARKQYSFIHLGN